MLHFLDFLRPAELDWLTVIVRMVLAFLCGGIVGMEREQKRRPAGFRTHILICMGAAVTTMTSQFLVFELGLFTDMTRLGAQVIAGIGFIGTGTIIITRRRQIKGLTTAAGLWVAAIVGLAIGAGYYEAGVLTTVLILVAEIVLSRIEYSLRGSSSFNISVIIEYESSKCLGNIISSIRDMGLQISDMEVTKSTSSGRPCAVFSLEMYYKKKIKYETVIATLSAVEGVISVEQL